MIDYIGSKRVAIRRTDHGVMISRLRDQTGLELDEYEWPDLVGMILAIKTAIEYATVNQ